MCVGRSQLHDGPNPRPHQALVYLLNNRPNTVNDQQVQDTLHRSWLPAPTSHLQKMRSVTLLRVFQTMSTSSSFSSSASSIITWDDADVAAAYDSSVGVFIMNVASPLLASKVVPNRSSTHTNLSLTSMAVLLCGCVAE